MQQEVIRELEIKQSEDLKNLELRKKTRTKETEKKIRKLEMENR